MLTVKCRKCSMNEHCICIPSSDECDIRTESYNKAIDEFVEEIQKAYSEMKAPSQVEKSTASTIAMGIAEKLKK